MSIMRWGPWGELGRVRDEIVRLFDTRFGLGESGVWGPSVDVHESDREVRVVTELPGVDPDETDVSVGEDYVVIRGESRRSEELTQRGYTRTERRYGAFQRTIPLPARVLPDQASAEYKDGVLTIKLPKAEPGREAAKRLRITRLH